MLGGSILDRQPAILSDAGAQFLKQNVGTALVVGVRFDEGVIETGREVQVEIGADVLGFNQRTGHRPESHDCGVVHSLVMA